ncbi:MAG: histidinol phosphate phosphatase domain-containing protein [Deltaproteobacteria bacterium]|nr:histidinol phosphate phosphatase domain-containing protein [Deltaproteobacteria bacterium]
MIDLHTHSLFSDGELVPSELVRRLEDLGYEAVAITDHADPSTIDFILPRICEVAEELNKAQAVRVIPGIELTHIPPALIGPMVERVRDLGARIVVIHGESIVEPVAPGTNLAGLKAGADIIAHPGLISLKEASLAVEKDVCLELSARSGHSLTNGHVARTAREAGARLVLNSDAHAPGDLMTKAFARKIAQGAGLPPGSLDELMSNSRRLLERLAP